MLYTLVALPFYLNYMFSIAASLLSVLTLLRSRDLTEIQRQRLAGSRKILLMNVGVTVLSFMMIVDEVDVQTSWPGQPNEVLLLVVWNIFPRSLAVLNPLVFIVLTWEKMRGSWWRRRRVSVVSSVVRAASSGVTEVNRQNEVKRQSEVNRQSERCGVERQSEVKRQNEGSGEVTVRDSEVVFTKRSVTERRVSPPS